jgi:Pin2-interacting protein X1
MAEVLGISSTTSASVTESTTPVLEPLPLDPEMEKITTSSKSVMDYFKEKLMAKSNHASGDTPPSEVDDEVISRPGLGTSRAIQSAGNDAMPRFGPAVALENSVSELATTPSALDEEITAADESKEARRARKAAKRLAKLANTSVTEDSAPSMPSEESKADRKARRRRERANASEA